MNEGAKGEDVTTMELPDGAQHDEWELVDLSDMSSYREWCVPAEVLNSGHHWLV